MAEPRRLTVTCGAFTCVVEGFDDPFIIMRMVVDYFQSLSRTNPSFGTAPMPVDSDAFQRHAGTAVASGPVSTHVDPDSGSIRVSGGAAAVPPSGLPRAAPEPRLGEVPSRRGQRQDRTGPQDRAGVAEKRPATTVPGRLPAAGQAAAARPATPRGGAPARTPPAAGPVPAGPAALRPAADRMEAAGLIPEPASPSHDDASQDWVQAFSDVLNDADTAQPRAAGEPPDTALAEKPEGAAAYHEIAALMAAEFERYSPTSPPLASGPATPAEAGAGAPVQTGPAADDRSDFFLAPDEPVAEDDFDAESIWNATFEPRAPGMPEPDLQARAAVDSRILTSQQREEDALRRVLAAIEKRQGELEGAAEARRLSADTPPDTRAMPAAPLPATAVRAVPGPEARDITRRVVVERPADRDRPLPPLETGSLIGAPWAGLESLVAAPSAPQVTAAETPRFRLPLSDLLFRNRKPATLPPEATAQGRTDNRAELEFVLDEAEFVARSMVGGGPDATSEEPLRLTDAVDATDSLAEDGEDAADPPDGDANQLRVFTRKMGAASLAELLEASAAYATLVRGQSQFSRRDIMLALEEIGSGKDYTPEARIKSFGKLLRNGSIVRVDDGKFALSSAARFSYEARLGTR